MIPKEVELILARHLASCLTTPIFIVDTLGNLVFYNEPAEEILGCRFEETGEMPSREWATIFTPMDEAGNPVAENELPLMISLTERRSALSEFTIRSLDGLEHHISVTSLPLFGQAERFLGAIAFFWKENKG